VHDIAHVRAIDPHPERDRGDDDVRPLVEKRLLMAAADLVGQTRVVGHGGMAFLLQPGGKRLDVLAGSAIHNPRFALVPGEYLKQLTTQVAAPQDPIGEIRPIERPDQHERIPQPQLGDDVAADALGGRGGERVERRGRKIVAQTSQPPILRSEVVPPLADAVRLVDGDEPEADLLQDSPERFAAVADQPLGRHVQQPAAALAQAREDGVALDGEQRAVQIRRLDAVDAEPVDLILHQRDERRHDQRQPATGGRVPMRIDQGGRLKADRLAAARGQDDHAVARAENGVHRFPLQRPEARKAPHPMEHVPQRAISVWRIGSRRNHRPDAGMPPRALRRCRAGS
jgi:hypothetical protein